MSKRLIYNFTDGNLEYGKYETVRNELGEKTGKELKPIGNLFFNYKSIRSQDYDLYTNGTDKTVDLKVETYYLPEVKKSHKVVIDNQEYDITGLDRGYDGRTMYWYLSEGGDAIGN